MEFELKFESELELELRRQNGREARVPTMCAISIGRLNYSVERLLIRYCENATIINIEKKTVLSSFSLSYRVSSFVVVVVGIGSAITFVPLLVQPGNLAYSYPNKQ